MTTKIHLFFRINRRCNLTGLRLMRHKSQNNQHDEMWKQYSTFQFTSVNL